MYINERGTFHYITVWPLHIKTMQSFLPGFEVSIRVKTWKRNSYVLISWPGYLASNLKPSGFYSQCRQVWPDGQSVSISAKEDEVPAYKVPLLANMPKEQLQHT